MAERLIADQISSYNRQPVGWLAPDRISREAAMDARRQLPAAFGDLKRAAQKDIVAWLTMLGLLTRGGRESQEATRLKVEAYASMLADYPARVFTREMMDLASEKFSYFPSLAEIKQLLADDRQKLEERAFRLEQIAAFDEEEEANG